jgi:D,D-heptose 1,7-bisphosphate phosphatase
MLRPAVFLDRDGTINFDPGYIKNPDEVFILDGVAEGIKKLKDVYGFKIIVISNQAGVAKGLMTISDVESINEKINELLKSAGTSIDAFYYCPFHPDYDSPEKSKYRKPSPLMIIEATEEHKIDLKKSFMVGDRASDIEAGVNANIKTVLLKTPKIEEDIAALTKVEKMPDFIAADFKDVYDYIVKNISK